MPVDKVKNSKQDTVQNVTWETLVSVTEKAIAQHRNKIKELNKSMTYFKSQAGSGVPFSSLIKPVDK